MTKLIVNEIDSRTASTEFKDIITANHSKQWLDTYGVIKAFKNTIDENVTCLLYTSPSPRDRQKSRMPSSA